MVQHGLPCPHRILVGAKSVEPVLDEVVPNAEGRLDRVRDGVRGGGPFSGLQEQGFTTGLFYDPNATDQGTPADQQARLLMQADWIRVSLAGGLANFPLIDRFGNSVLGRQIDYNGKQAGYTLDPQEIIN